MTRLISTAIVVGAALALATLGVVDGFSRPHIPEAQRTQASFVRTSLDEYQSRLPASHSDSNTDPDEVVYLNQRIIDGETTNICTAEAEFTGKLRTAVNEWNRALADLGRPLTIVRTPNCADTNATDVDVVLRRATAVDNNAMRCLTARACYIARKHRLPPRKFFYYDGSLNHAAIVYRATDVTIGTLLHELGHVLGLAHYDGADQCSILRSAPVDPAGDHFSVMTGTGSNCKSNYLVTGRDLRDFYEEYHVGPVTNIAHRGSTALPSPGGTRISLDWGDSGGTEAWHSASHFVVMAQTSTGWRFVRSFSVSRRDPKKTENEDGAYRAISAITFDDPSGPAAMYKVVGVTQGDPQLHALDEDVTFTTAGSSATYQQGDPAFILGISAGNPFGLTPNLPAVLSASIDHQYCYAGGARGTISRRASGGSGTPTLLPITQTVCPYQVGERTISAAARWGSGQSAITRRIALPVQVIRTPQAFRQVRTTITPTATSGAVQVSECAAGERVTVEAIPAPNPAPTVVVNGVRQATTTSSFVCPTRTAARLTVKILVLRNDGGGTKLSRPIIDPLKVMFSTGSTTPARICTAGSNGSTRFYITGGKSPYSATLGGRAIPANDLRKGYNPTNFLEYPCPNTGTTLRVSVTDVVGRTASATAPLNVTPAPTSPVTPPPTPPAQPPPTPPVTDPLAPTNVRVSTSVTATAATATLTWTPPAGASNVSYKLWRSEATGNSSTTGTTYTFENLNPYQTYNLYVWTVNAAGVESAKVVTQVKMPGRPGVPRTAAPTGLQASNITTSSATLGWNAVPGATGYRVWRSSGQSVRLPATARSYTFAGLLPSRKYSLTVWAIGHGGLSPTARVVIHTQGPTLATPTGLRATTSVTATTATATLTWSAVSGVASYGLWRSDGQNVTTTGTSYTFTGLIPHKRYNLYVWTVDSAGHGSTHARVSVTLPGRPGVAQTAAPTGVQASGITANSATLSWNGVAGATGYEVWRSGGQSVDLAATARSYTFTGLTGERRYSLYVWALGSGGMSPQARVTITTLPAPPPPPGELRATATSTTLTLRWDSAAGATGYEVMRSGDSTVRTVSSGQTYHTFRGLTAGASYTLYVRSKNNNGPSAWVTLLSVTAPPRPDVPSIAATHNSLKLSWSSVRGATGYEVKLRNDGAVRTVASGKNYHTFSRLSSNESYTLFVRAKNAGGESAWRSQTGTTLLPNPTGVRVSAKTSSSLTLSWTLDSRADWYRVKRAPGGREELLSPSQSSYEFSGLTANTSYTLYVRAVGSGGLTEWSSISARTATSQAAVAPPSGLTVSEIGKTSVKLTWTAASGASGYEVRKNDGSATTVSGTEYTFSDLTLDTAYTLEVRAKSGSRASGWVSTTTRTAAFEARLRARRLSNGRVEFCIQVDSQIGTTRCLLPTSRYVTPSDMTAGRTRYSSSVSATIGGASRTIGQIAATKPSGAAYLKVCFRPHGGVEVCPASNTFRWASSTVNRWRSTATAAYQLPPATSGATGTAGAASDDGTMDIAGPNEPDPPWIEGGSME